MTNPKFKHKKECNYGKIIEGFHSVDCICSIDQSNQKIEQKDQSKEWKKEFRKIWKISFENEPGTNPIDNIEIFISHLLESEKARMFEEWQQAAFKGEQLAYFSFAEKLIKEIEKKIDWRQCNHCFDEDHCVGTNKKCECNCIYNRDFRIKKRNDKKNQAFFEVIDLIKKEIKSLITIKSNKLIDGGQSLKRYGGDSLQTVLSPLPIS